MYQSLGASWCHPWGQDLHNGADEWLQGSLGAPRCIIPIRKVLPLDASESFAGATIRPGVEDAVNPSLEASWRHPWRQDLHTGADGGAGEVFRGSPLIG
ncbi:hypothetical protein [Halorhodospira halochloris]|uniref:hypothetical protein n=1 Tax=Halorhodospira halochloris TaxID=1052 RepID=UPI0013A58FD8|nr:hypothetical protein [Halorhodospira halochloris]